MKQCLPILSTQIMEEITENKPNCCMKINKNNQCKERKTYLGTNQYIRADNAQLLLYYHKGWTKKVIVQFFRYQLVYLKGAYMNIQGKENSTARTTFHCSGITICWSYKCPDDQDNHFMTSRIFKWAYHERSLSSLIRWHQLQKKKGYQFLKPSKTEYVNIYSLSRNYICNKPTCS